MTPERKLFCIIGLILIAVICFSVIAFGYLVFGITGASFAIGATAYWVGSAIADVLREKRKEDEQ